ncbi:PH domain-containing protein [Sphingobacterium hotanense]|uniref:PH domain-containing protein n=1 Tax=Sphingobacterium hotanense TaxID=649196 RepID=UPI0021A4190E|nr:PH domain-containing protein [Sphingobacterium hotanense]MCT1523286.1 PH domain-containing protein [Sphingobacterium hotanense]
MENYQIDKYIQDGQDPKVVEKIHGKILDMLTPGESINYIALQKKPAVTLLPDSITVSNKRLFLCEFTKLGLATNFEIFAWQEVKDIAFKEEIFGSKVTVIPFTGENLTIDYIPKTQARKLYQLIKAALDNLQNQKQEPKESKIVIENKPVYGTPTPTSKPELEKPIVAPTPEVTKPSIEEEKREERPSPAPSLNDTFQRQDQRQSGFQSPSTPPSSYAAAAPKAEEDDEITLKLKKLKTLYDKQLITQAEYETKKAEILSTL